MFYGLSAVALTMLALYGIAFYIAPFTNGAMAQGNFMNLYLSNFWYLFGGLALLGITLGVVSSAIAIRRYLKG